MRFSEANALEYLEQLRELECLLKLQQKQARKYGEGDLVVAHVNSVIDFALNFGRLNDHYRTGFFSQHEASELVQKTFGGMTRHIDEKGLRLLATKVAYEASARLPSAGSRDSRMQAAMAYAANLTGMTGTDPVEAIKKSNTRYKREVLHEKLFRFDASTLRLEEVDTKKEIFGGLPDRPGRPSKKSQTESRVPFLFHIARAMLTSSKCR